VASRWVTVLVWALGGAAVMYAMGAAISHEFADFPGGSEVLAASVTRAAEGMRIMRWPAERLDTLGGYLTYHNVTLLMLGLAIYGAVQGARMVRGGEDRHSLEEVLATGWTRWAVIRDRTAGFLIIMVVISLALGLGTAAALAAGGEPDLSGSLLTMVAVGLCGMVGYSLGLLVSQLTPTARAAAGVSSIVLTALYVLNNVWEELHWFGTVRFISPFYYADFSRALVPGYGLHLPATAALVAMSVLLVGLAAWAFERRDYGAALWVRRRARARRAVLPSLQSQRAFGSAWTAMLFRSRFGLIAWACGAGAFSLLMMALEPAVIDMWSTFSKYMPGTGGGKGIPIETVYVGFAAEVVALVIVAYVIVQAAGWSADLAEGRVEAVLATPVSWPRLVWERLLALLVGVGCVAAGSIAGLAVGAAAVELELDWSGVARLAADCILLGAALGGLASVVVAVFRRGAGVTVLAVLMTASYLQGYIAKMFEWPTWVERYSLFSAFGNPYVAWAGLGETILLLALAVGGAVLAAAIAERTPKVA
jgi:ABC-2 type transport system permease protein